ncbi:MAG: hypothetical protein WBL23_17875 [Salinisphaera sp.]|uniref:GFA family protein n=1 Tax=Salinisphaera sp. TaxID=1914330 RepID=UPI003C7AAE54
MSAALTDIVIIEGGELLRCYQFGTKTAKPYFCSCCGIHTHHRRRWEPDQYGVNVAGLEGLTLFDSAEVPVAKSVEHPRDRDNRKRASLAGVLRFEPTAPDPQPGSSQPG